jgi:hypothetical protein
MADEDSTKLLRELIDVTRGVADALGTFVRSKREKAASQAAPDTPPFVLPPPTPCELYQPRDKFGQPIPVSRPELMTMKQRRARYGYRGEEQTPEEVLVAEAIAEEEAMIAAEAARQQQ